MGDRASKGLRGLTPVSGEDVTTRLIRYFKLCIRTGKFQRGHRLPPERDLTAELRVNRSSLRQALKVLRWLGVVEQRVGDGTYLCSDARAVLREPLEFLLLLSDVSSSDLYNLRLLIEPRLAAAATERVTTADLAGLLSAIGALERSRTVEERIEADLAFHEALFQASGDHLCLLILTVIHRAILDSMRLSARWMKLESTVKAHTSIYRAIEKRDAAAVTQAVIRHLTESRASVCSEPGARS